MAISARFVDSNAERSFRLVGLPVYVYGYLGTEKSNLTLITDGITDNRGRINFFLPAGSYIINFRYQLFGSNVTIDLPLTRSIVELDWTVSRRILEPITLVFTDRYAVRELGPGDIIDVYFPSEEERLPVVVNVGPTIQTAIEPDPNFLLDVKGGLQSDGNQWVQLSLANEVLLTQMDPKTGVDYTAYWVTVREATRPWR